MKDEKKLRGAVDKFSSEQHFRKLDMITLNVRKSGAILLVLVGLLWQAGRQSDEIREDLKKFGILY